jgi:formate-dependent nitrite reductase membrane component NrfD
MKREILMAMGLLCLASLAAADLVIPPDQPVCRLYGMIQLFATIGGILAAAYAGFTLATNHDLAERNNAKLLLSGVVIGLIIVWLAPLVVKNLVNATDVCGW